MVFYATTKGRDACQKPSSLATLTGLADELLLGVLAPLDNQTLANLRLANRNIARACNTKLAARLTRLYVHPTEPSLRQALAICAHRMFRTSIEEVVFLGKADWHAITNQRRGTESLVSNYLDGNYCAWPARLPADKKVGKQGHATDMIGLREAYEPLVAALTSLPNLRTLRFAGKAQQDGWNKSSQAVIDAHANKITINAASRCPPRFSDLDVMGGLLTSEQMNITCLQFDEELPFPRRLLIGGEDHKEYVLDMRRAFSRPLGCTKLWPSLDSKSPCGLASLDLTLINREEADLTQTFYAQIICISLPTLLRLRLVTYGRMKYRDICNNLKILPTAPFESKLESLTLEYTDPPLPRACKDIRRRPRPVMQRLDLEAFLDQVKHSIQHISIKNMMFKRTDFDPTIAAEVFERVSDAVLAGNGSAFPKLEHFEWRMNRLIHDERCKSKTMDITRGNCLTLNCGWYPEFCYRTSIEALADRMGAHLEPGEHGMEFGTWDFGAAIMMKLRMEREQRG